MLRSRAITTALHTPGPDLSGLQCDVDPAHHLADAIAAGLVDIIDIANRHGHLTYHRQITDPDHQALTAREALDDARRLVDPDEAADWLAQLRADVHLAAHTPDLSHDQLATLTHLVHVDAPALTQLVAMPHVQTELLAELRSIPGALRAELELDLEPPTDHEFSRRAIAYERVADLTDDREHHR